MFLTWNACLDSGQLLHTLVKIETTKFNNSSVNPYSRSPMGLCTISNNGTPLTLLTNKSRGIIGKTAPNLRLLTKPTLLFQGSKVPTTQTLLYKWLTDPARNKYALGLSLLLAKPEPRNLPCVTFNWRVWSTTVLVCFFISRKLMTKFYHLARVLLNDVLRSKEKTMMYKLTTI